METAHRGGGYKLTVNRDVVPVTSRGHHELDPKWKTTDQAGHKHSSYETLEWVVTSTYWCDTCRDEHEEGEYRCRECGSVVEPRYRWTGEQTTYVPGLVEARLDMDDGRSFLLTPEEATMTWPPSDEWLARVTAREPDWHAPKF